MKNPTKCDSGDMYPHISSIPFTVNPNPDLKAGQNLNEFWVQKYQQW